MALRPQTVSNTMNQSGFLQSLQDIRNQSKSMRSFRSKLHMLGKTKSFDYHLVLSFGCHKVYIFSDVQSFDCDNIKYLFPLKGIEADHTIASYAEALYFVSQQYYNNKKSTFFTVLNWDGVEQIICETIPSNLHFLVRPEMRKVFKNRKLPFREAISGLSMVQKDATVISRAIRKREGFIYDLLKKFYENIEEKISAVCGNNKFLIDLDL